MMNRRDIIKSLAAIPAFFLPGFTQAGPTTYPPYENIEVSFADKDKLSAIAERQQKKYHSEYVIIWGHTSYFIARYVNILDGGWKVKCISQIIQNASNRRVCNDVYMRGFLDGISNSNIYNKMFDATVSCLYAKNLQEELCYDSP